MQGNLPRKDSDVRLSVSGVVRCLGLSPIYSLELARALLCRISVSATVAEAKTGRKEKHVMRRRQMRMKKPVLVGILASVAAGCFGAAEREPEAAFAGARS